MPTYQDIVTASANDVLSVNYLNHIIDNYILWNEHDHAPSSGEGGEKLKVASNDRPALAAPMLHLAAALMGLQAQIAGGTANAQTVQNALVASTKMLPILAKGDETKVSQGLKLASKIATAA